MPESDFELIHKLVLSKLEELSPNLTYHSIEHTLDVVEHATRIAIDESINEKEIYLLRVAALYHDTGFLHAYAGHEKISCEIFLQDNEDFNFSEGNTKIIIDLIMATKVPQRPKNLLQKIICDADLDYLGRHDFTKIAGHLKQEFFNFKIVGNESDWHKLQLKFLEKHHYHTNSSQLLREPLKKVNYKGLL